VEIRDLDARCFSMNEHIVLVCIKQLHGKCRKILELEMDYLRREMFCAVLLKDTRSELSVV
jgi:hypothetical protein